MELLNFFGIQFKKEKSSILYFSLALLPIHFVVDETETKGINQF